MLFRSDLNIINLAQERFDFAIYFQNGAPMHVRNRNLDFFNEEEISICFAEDDYNEILTVHFYVNDSEYDIKNNCAVVAAEKLKITYDEDYDEERVKKVKQLIIDRLEIRKVRERRLHYAV